jgi:hypothetical protein
MDGQGGENGAEDRRENVSYYNMSQHDSDKRVCACGAVWCTDVAQRNNEQIESLKREVADGRRREASLEGKAAQTRSAWLCE